MSFFATAPENAAEAPPEAAKVANDGFYPDIELDRLRAAMRLDGTVTQERLRPAVIAAVIEVNGEFAAWKAARQLEGVQSLAELSPKIDGEAVQLHLYLAAVYRTVKADLNEQYRNFDNTKSGIEEAEKLEQIILDDRGAAKKAIRDFLGKSRTTVELI